MRSFRLARLAAEAEILRLRMLLRRQAMRAVLGAVAAVFLIAVLVSLHVAAALALVEYMAPWAAALVVAGIDLIGVIVFGLLAMRDTPSEAEREALLVRKRAQSQAMEAATLATMAGPVLRLVGTRKAYGLALAALTARYLGGGRKQ